MNGKRGKTQRFLISENIRGGGFHYFYLERQRRYWRLRGESLLNPLAYSSLRATFGAAISVDLKWKTRTPRVQSKVGKTSAAVKVSHPPPGLLADFFSPLLLFCFFPFCFSAPLQKVWPALDLTFPLDWLCHRSWSGLKFKGTSLWTHAER